MAAWPLVALALIVSGERRLADLHTSSTTGRVSIQTATPDGDAITIRLLALDDTAQPTPPDLLSGPLRTIGTLHLIDPQRRSSRSIDQPSLRAPPRAVPA